MANLKVNGQQVQVDADDDTPLLWVLREDLGLVGTKFGCGRGLCGACTVHLDGQAVRSCSTPLSAAKGGEVTTIEGYHQSEQAKIVAAAWLEADVVQCGYCQPGQIMNAAAFLASNKAPSDAAIDAAMVGNLCRCGTYPRLRAAIRLAANKLNQGS